MEIYVFNPDLKRIGVIDIFDSLIWNRKYFSSGDFELHLKPNKRNLKLLVPDNIINFSSKKEAGVIEYINPSIDDNGNRKFIVKGRFLTGSYLSRRINLNFSTFKGKLKDFIIELFNNNLISPEDNDRKIDTIFLGDLENCINNVSISSSYKYIDEILETLSKSYNINFSLDLLLNDGNNKIVLNATKGKVTKCVFSSLYENILNESYTKEIKDFKNSAIVAGEGEGDQRKIQFINDGVGINRRELFIDARDLQTSNDEILEDGTTITTEISETDYIDLLNQRGLSKLKEYICIESLNANINLNQCKYKYGIDYDLGDTVKIISEFDVVMSPQITEIKEVYERGFLKIEPVFGDSTLTITKKIKRSVS